MDQMNENERQEENSEITDGDNRFSVSTTQRGVKCIHYKGQRYRLFRKTTQNLCFRCTYYSCSALICMDFLCTKIVKEPSPHIQHSTPGEENLKKTRFRELCKQAAVENMTETPQNIINNESKDNNVIVAPQLAKQIKSSVYRKRKNVGKIYTLSKRVNHVIATNEEGRFETRSFSVDPEAFENLNDTVHDQDETEQDQEETEYVISAPDIVNVKVENENMFSYSPQPINQEEEEDGIYSGPIDDSYQMNSNTIEISSNNVVAVILSKMHEEMQNQSLILRQNTAILSEMSSSLKYLTQHLVSKNNK